MEGAVLEPLVFFEQIDPALVDLFRADEPVWTALDRLGGHLAALFTNAWPLQGRTGLVERPFAIHEGRVLDRVELVREGPKGGLVARAGGAVLEGAAIVMAGAYLFDDRVILGPGTVVEPGALLKGPTVIGRDSEVRQGAYVRGTCLVGDGCVIGHTTEVKGSIMLDGAKAGHFAYIGDSILGRTVNLGAGTKLANLKMVPGTVTVPVAAERRDTGRRKLGAVLGDRTEMGCNSVTSPGTLLGPGSLVSPTVTVPAGFYPSGTVVRAARGSITIRSSG